MLRVARACGTPVETVRLSTTFHPSGRRRTFDQRTAAGLCMIPWLGEESRVSIVVEDAGRTAHVTVARDREDAGRVRELVV